MEEDTLINSAKEFAQLRTSSNRHEQWRAAHEDASVETWMAVIELYPDLRKWVAHNKTVPLEVLAVLAKDPDSDVRSWVADKRKLSPELFHLLSQDSDESVRARIACNKKVPTDILAALCRDKEWIVYESAQERYAARVGKE